MSIRYFTPEGDSIEQMKEHARQHPLYTEGDLTLVWVNEGDLHGESLDSLEQYYVDQINWSKQVFGPALRTKGIIQHITKELAEIESNPHDLSEWVDVIMLAMDGYWRHGGSAFSLLHDLRAKQRKNVARVWPDYRTVSEDVAIEHVQGVAL